MIKFILPLILALSVATNAFPVFTNGTVSSNEISKTFEELKFKATEESLSPKFHPQVLGEVILKANDEDQFATNELKTASYIPELKEDKNSNITADGILDKIRQKLGREDQPCEVETEEEEETEEVEAETNIPDDDEDDDEDEEDEEENDDDDSDDCVDSYSSDEKVSLDSTQVDSAAYKGVEYTPYEDHDYEVESIKDTEERQAQKAKEFNFRDGDIFLDPGCDISAASFTKFNSAITFTVVVVSIAWILL